MALRWTATAAFWAEQHFSRIEHPIPPLKFALEKYFVDDIQKNANKKTAVKFNY